MEKTIEQVRTEANELLEKALAEEKENYRRIVREYRMAVLKDVGETLLKELSKGEATLQLPMLEVSHFESAKLIMKDSPYYSIEIWANIRDNRSHGGNIYLAKVFVKVGTYGEHPVTYRAEKAIDLKYTNIVRIIRKRVAQDILQRQRKEIESKISVNHIAQERRNEPLSKKLREIWGQSSAMLIYPSFLIDGVKVKLTLELPESKALELINLVKEWMGEKQ